MIKRIELVCSTLVFKIKLPTTGRYMQLASIGFCAPVRQTGTPKPIGALSARLSG